MAQEHLHGVQMASEAGGQVQDRAAMEGEGGKECEASKQVAGNHQATSPALFIFYFETGSY